VVSGSVSPESSTLLRKDPERKNTTAARQESKGLPVAVESINTKTKKFEITRF
jgi:hypothetical protein